MLVHARSFYSGPAAGSSSPLPLCSTTRAIPYEELYAIGVHHNDTDFRILQCRSGKLQTEIIFGTKIDDYLVSRLFKNRATNKCREDT